MTVRARTARGEHAPRWALAAFLAAVAALGGTTVWQHQQTDEARQGFEARGGREPRAAPAVPRGPTTWHRG
ncbi:hypothetical protein [Streptomyces sp. NPDC059262]|uniref:hypothetical protein n=1 Tax=Streptomyces sp. NPDC059262 TaxID=3346797 RepID=UPI0036CCB366